MGRRDNHGQATVIRGDKAKGNGPRTVSCSSEGMPQTDLAQRIQEDLLFPFPVPNTGFLFDSQVYYYNNITPPTSIVEGPPTRLPKITAKISLH